MYAYKLKRFLPKNLQVKTFRGATFSTGESFEEMFYLREGENNKSEEIVRVYIAGVKGSAPYQFKGKATNITLSAVYKQDDIWCIEFTCPHLTDNTSYSLYSIIFRYFVKNGDLIHLYGITVIEDALIPVGCRVSNLQYNSVDLDFFIP